MLMKTPDLQHGWMLIHAGQALSLYGEFLYLRTHNRFIFLLLRVFLLPNKLPQSYHRPHYKHLIFLVVSWTFTGKTGAGLNKHPSKPLA